jgi:hypothetical protein
MRERKGTLSEELYDKIWKTRGTRFNAYGRLRRRQKRSFYATGFLSAYLIIINLLQPFNLFVLPTDSNMINFISVSLSIILLVFVTIENSAEYNLKGDKFHNCSKELGRIFNDLHSLMAKNEADQTKYEEISKRYSDVLDRYDNHSPIDYEVHKTQHINDFKINFVQRKWILLRANILNDFHYFAFMFGPPILFVIWISNK